MPRLQLPSIRPSEITAERFFHMRRDVLTAALGLAATAALPAAEPAAPATPAPGAALKYTRNAKYTVADQANTFEEISGYNNF